METMKFSLPGSHYLLVENIVIQTQVMTTFTSRCLTIKKKRKKNYANGMKRTQQSSKGRRKSLIIRSYNNLIKEKYSIERKIADMKKDYDFLA